VGVGAPARRSGAATLPEASGQLAGCLSGGGAAAAASVGYSVAVEVGDVSEVAVTTSVMLAW
jgi:hypothetical protein